MAGDAVDDARQISSDTGWRTPMGDMFQWLDFVGNQWYP